MLLDVELSIGIKHTKRHILGPCDADRIRQQLRDERADGDTGLTQTEQLIQSAADLIDIVS